MMYPSMKDKSSSMLYCAILSDTVVWNFVRLSGERPMVYAKSVFSCDCGPQSIKGQLDLPTQLLLNDMIKWLF